MQALAVGWELDVERGPDWLLVRVQTLAPVGSERPSLAEHLWSLLEQHFTYRLVLELDKVPVLDSYLIGQLLELCRRIEEHDGVMRLCGLSSYNRQVLHACRGDEHLLPYEDREEAVLGQSRRAKPR